MKEKKLTIKYDGEPDEELEDFLEKGLKELGWKFEGHGYSKDFEEDKTEISFYK